MIRCPLCGAIIAVLQGGYAVCGGCQKKAAADPKYEHTGIYLVRIEEMEKQHGPRSTE